MSEEKRVQLYLKEAEMSHDEKVSMYMKFKKADLIEMLIECNRIMRAMVDQSPILSMAQEEEWESNTEEQQ